MLTSFPVWQRMNGQPKKVIGVSFDGTGYGTDGTIWGGEILLADYDSFTRWGCIEPFAQTGGDVSAKKAGELPYLFLERFTERKMPFRLLKH